MMKNRRKKGLLMIAGTITALLIVVFQCFFFETTRFCLTQLTEIEADQADDCPAQATKEDKKPTLSMPTDSVLSSIQIDLNNKIVFLFEFLQEEEKEPEHSPNTSFALGKYLKILIPLIISPNAP